MTRYRAYQVHLAGHTTGESFGRAAAFLKLAAMRFHVLDGVAESGRSA